MYESHFGLITKPFQLSPDPDFFFSSSGHKRAMSYLQYGLGQGEGFIVVTGEIGTGKTTLMRNLLNNIDQSRVIAAQLVTTKLEADDLLRLICSSFGLPAENKAKAVLLQQFHDFLQSAHHVGKRVLLIVDEAQNLPASAIEELRMLSNFQLTDAPLLQSFLLGQPELRGIIQRPDMEQFRQRIIASCHLKPLEAVEVKEYIQWRLSVAGWAQNPKFTDITFAVIHGHTGGVPRRINIFCDRLLLFCFLEEISTITVDAVNTVATELSDELNPQVDYSRAPVVAAPPVPTQAPVAVSTPAFSGRELEQLQQIEQKIASINNYLNQTLEEKLELIRTLDKKLKQKINQLME
ncbi:MAG: XrtA/PEP-CTERM system-associated ATPase [Halopseudomonas sp.]